MFLRNLKAFLVFTSEPQKPWNETEDVLELPILQYYTTCQRRRLLKFLKSEESIFVVAPDFLI